jgi:predicted metal-dependent hydrolase
MGQGEAMRAGNHYQIELSGRRINYRLVASRSARRLRIRVSINGIDVVRPVSRTDQDVSAFLDQNKGWILDQIHRVDRLRKIRLADRRHGEILFRGEHIHIRFEETAGRSHGNVVRLVDGEIVVRHTSGARTPVARSLENWLRRQARAEIGPNGETVLPAEICHSIGD